jgi:cell shape-determining protein MreD
MVLFTIAAFLCGIALAVAESIFLRPLTIWHVRPDIAVLAAVVAASRADYGKAMTLAFLLGLIRDFFTGGATGMNSFSLGGVIGTNSFSPGGVIGMNAFSLTFMAYLLVLTKDYLVTDNWTAQMFVAFIGCSVFGILFAVLKVTLQYDAGSGFHILRAIVLTSIYTSAFAPIAFQLTKKPPHPLYPRLKMKYNVEYETLPENKV